MKSTKLFNFSCAGRGQQGSCHSAAAAATATDATCLI